ncbi:MAG: FtsX-like permease family protein [Clostridia bacterium]|jgi:putative ABC transport system permease protein|nr:FtsX-like permease family protein [Clostridia bacterium]MCI8979641.1 FtsX-like permease family protein [Clostridia bacterium]MCI9085054.1 FtsX-like permease family protein [Clostridia bacterium]NDO19582.1 FtsX-like permease family protein [Lachnospiraceae bacterium MD329]
MGIGKCFKMAMATIWSSKVRSFLTMLGIIIGIAAVIILVSLMGGLTQQLTDMFAEIGTNTIQVSITPRNGKKVEPDEFYKFAEENKGLIDDVSPAIVVSGTIKNGTENASGSAQGVSESFVTMKKLEVTQGRFIQYADVAGKSNICVIGSYQEEKFFGKGQAIGKKLKLNGVPLTVVGVLKEKEDSASGSGDDVVYIPYTTAMRLSGSTIVTTYGVNAVDEEHVDEATSAIKQFLNKKMGDDNYYMVISMKEMIDQMSTMMNSMQTVLVCIAGISLLVGGIGIMNIMLVSVTERTREIGIRKSLGAKQKNIMMQFVIEAGTVSCIGGVIGIILGALVAVGAGQLLLKTTITPSVASIIIAFTVSVGIGIGFGYLPAKKAAQLNPIDALRYD